MAELRRTFEPREHEPVDYEGLFRAMAPAERLNALDALMEQATELVGALLCAAVGSGHWDSVHAAENRMHQTLIYAFASADHELDLYLDPTQTERFQRMLQRTADKLESIGVPVRERES